MSAYMPEAFRDIQMVCNPQKNHMSYAIPHAAQSELLVIDPIDEDSSSYESIRRQFALDKIFPVNLQRDAPDPNDKSGLSFLQKNNFNFCFFQLFNPIERTSESQTHIAALTHCAGPEDFLEKTPVFFVGDVFNFLTLAKKIGPEANNPKKTIFDFPEIHADLALRAKNLEIFRGVSDASPIFSSQPDGDWRKMAAISLRSSPNDEFLKKKIESPVASALSLKEIRRIVPLFKLLWDCKFEILNFDKKVEIDT